MHMKNQTSNENVDINSPKTGLKKAIKSSTFSSMFLPRGLIIAPKQFLTDRMTIAANVQGRYHLLVCPSNFTPHSSSFIGLVATFVAIRCVF